MRLQGKVALITGASRGIGAAVAVAFAREGAELVLVARDMRGLEATDDRVQEVGGKCTLVPLDLSDAPKVDALAPWLLEQYGRLDILIGNAAILGPLMPLAQVSPQDWQQTLDINLTANWRLLRVCDPLLRSASAGRAVFVTSGVTQGVFPYWGPYAVTKTALEALIRTYAAEVKDTPVRANLLDPGVVRTQMRATAMPGENPLVLPLPETLVEDFIQCCLPQFTQNGVVIDARKPKLNLSSLKS